MHKLFLTLAALLLALSGGAVDLFVSSQGSDSHSGAREQPLATLAMALRTARELRRLNRVSEPVNITLLDSLYELQEPVFIRPEDSGTESSPTRILGTNTLLSGGVRVTAWAKASSVAGLPSAAQGKVWVADAPTVGGRRPELRQLWVNGAKAVRAQQVHTDSMPRILAWNVEDRTCDIPAPAQRLSTLHGVEMFMVQRWEIAHLRVKTMAVEGGSARLTFHEPESRVQFEHPWPSPVIDEENGSSAFMLVNAIEFLDAPGEWYLDAQHGKLYYYPRPGEDMRTAHVVAPVLETLVRVEGTADRPVSHVSFTGVGFAHSTWLRPSQQGHVPLQAGMYMLDAYKLQEEGLPWDAALENQAWIGRQPAAVEVRGASHVRFHRCNFMHMAASALDFVSAVQYSEVSACRFADVGGSAIVAGSFQEGSTEAHIPYSPADEREVCSHLLIAHNDISDAANEDWGCVGVSVGYAHSVTVAHNEVSHLPYSGICVGWGWTQQPTAQRNNRIERNHVHHFAKRLFAAGGLYTLSAQPGTVIRGNYVHDMVLSPYMQQPEYCYYIYLDGGSSHIEVHDNWCTEEKFGANNNGPNTWGHNGPTVSDEVRRGAGVGR